MMMIKSMFLLVVCLKENDSFLYNNYVYDLKKKLGKIDLIQYHFKFISVQALWCLLLKLGDLLLVLDKARGRTMI